MPKRPPLLPTILAAALAAGLLSVSGGVTGALAQTGAGTAQPAAQPASQPAWPRTYAVGSAQLQLYQPEAQGWNGDTLTGRAALAVGPKGGVPHYGFASVSARARVEKATVVLSDIRIDKVELPAAPDQAAAVRTALSSDFATTSVSLPLSLVKASAGTPPAAATAPDTAPPAIAFTDKLTVHVPVSGAPALRPVPGAQGFERVMNTQAMLLKDGGTYYLQAGGSWYQSAALNGPWAVLSPVPDAVEAAAKAANGVQQAAPLLPQDGQPISPPPAVVVSTKPTEVVQTDGPQELAPVMGTGLMSLSNADHAVFVDPSNGNFYVLISGRWFTAPAQTGPWTAVANDALPADFANISTKDPKASALISVAGTPQAKEAAIAATVPKTAVVSRATTATASYDGSPRFESIPGTGLRYAVNAVEPVIEVGGRFYLVSKGVWFTAPAPQGPWVLAVEVPPEIYAIPASSPVYYVTGARIYDVAPEAVTVGYTPVYMGVGIGPVGTVVYGTGYRYADYVGSYWVPAPGTFGYGAGFTIGVTGFSYGFAPGWSWGAGIAPHWGPYWGPTPFGRGWGFADVGFANIYGAWGERVTLGVGWGGVGIGVSAWSYGAWGGVGVHVDFGGFGGAFGGFSAYSHTYMHSVNNSHFSHTTINRTTINNDHTVINRNDNHFNDDHRDNPFGNRDRPDTPDRRDDRPAGDRGPDGARPPGDDRPGFDDRAAQQRREDEANRAAEENRQRQDDRDRLQQRQDQQRQDQQRQDQFRQDQQREDRARQDRDEDRAREQDRARDDRAREEHRDRPEREHPEREHAHEGGGERHRR